MGRDQRTRRTAPGMGAIEPRGAAALVAADDGAAEEPSEVDDAPGRAHDAQDADAAAGAPEADASEHGTPAGDEGSGPLDTPPEADDTESAGDAETSDAGAAGPAPSPVAAAAPALAPPVAPERSATWGILCRVVGPGSVAGHGIRLDGRPGHFWESGARGYFSQASVNKLPHLLLPESS